MRPRRVDDDFKSSGNMNRNSQRRVTSSRGDLPEDIDPGSNRGNQSNEDYKGIFANMGDTSDPYKSRFEDEPRFEVSRGNTKSGSQTIEDLFGDSDDNSSLFEDGNDTDNTQNGEQSGNHYQEADNKMSMGQKILLTIASGYLINKLLKSNLASKIPFLNKLGVKVEDAEENAKGSKKSTSKLGLLGTIIVLCFAIAIFMWATTFFTMYRGSLKGSPTNNDGGLSDVNRHITGGKQIGSVMRVYSKKEILPYEKSTTEDGQIIVKMPDGSLVYAYLDVKAPKGYVNVEIDYEEGTDRVLKVSPQTEYKPEVKKGDKK